MSKAIIAIDIDDVLGNENGAVREFMNKTYGFSHTAEDYLREGEYWGYWEGVWGVDKKTGAKMYETYAAAGIKAQHEPIIGVIDAINILKQNYQLVIVTMRDDRHVAETHEWLERHFPKTFDRVEFLPLWGDKNEITKAHIARELGASYLIDDNAEHCRLAAEAGLTALLFGTYGWNRSSVVTKGVIRVADWTEVLRYFDAL